MLIGEALETFGLADGIGQTYDTLNKLFKRLLFDNHPDRGGDHMKTVMIIDAWDTFKKTIKKDSKWSEWEASKAASYNVSDLFTEILSKIQHLVGLDIKIAGSWLWISGYQGHETELKKHGCSFSKYKKLYSWHPPNQRKGKGKKYRKTIHQDRIYERYGCEQVHTIHRTAVR